MFNKQRNMKQQREKLLKQYYTLAHLKPRTQKTYQVALNQYEQATGLTLPELYEEAIMEEDKRIPRHRRQIKQHIIEYIAYMDEQLNLSENTKYHKLNMIKSFYNTMDIDLPNVNNRFHRGAEKVNTQKMLTKPIIAEMIHNASIRDKAILSFMATTGQAQNEVRFLTIQQIIDSINTELVDEPIFEINELFERRDEILGHECFHLDMYRRKTQNYYWTYIPSEAIKHILNYLYYRIYGTNKNNLYIHSLDDYLFKTKNGKQMSTTAVGKVCTTVGRKCGFENPENLDAKTRKLLEHKTGKHRVWKSHNFRKYFLNMCRKYAGTTPDQREVWTGAELGDFWIGHKPNSSISHYLQYNSDDDRAMRKQYLQMLPYLSLEIETKTFTSRERQELDDLKRKYDEMEKELKLLKEYNHAKSVLREWED